MSKMDILYLFIYYYLNHFIFSLYCHNSKVDKEAEILHKFFNVYMAEKLVPRSPYSGK